MPSKSALELVSRLRPLLNTLDADEPMSLSLSGVEWALLLACGHKSLMGWEADGKPDQGPEDPIILMRGILDKFNEQLLKQGDR